ncbi:hypothetical protein [Streptomyces sp. NPDC048436]|uniref:hypothetical protein n=1 Tax=Streptomyces sp. NPDC048436 TaxID=3365550 RepID=UPI0037166740
MRRIAIVLVGITAAGFLSTVPAAANDGPSGHMGYATHNLGGPAGITDTAGFASFSDWIGHDGNFGDGS